MAYHAAMPEAQNFKNHGRFDPLFHFLIAPVLLANMIITIVQAFHIWHRQPFMAVWGAVIGITLFVLAFKLRSYPLSAQDRVIRLEERLRFAALLPADQLAKTSQLSLQQIIALRFVSDDELPSVVHRTLTENLTPKQIKQTIKAWRPDYTRV